MLINIEQRLGKLIISYVNKDGDIAFSQLIVPPNHQYAWLYSKNKNTTTPGFVSWDGKPVVKVPSQFLNKHRMQEFFLDAGEDNTNHLFERNAPKLFSCDIEVEVTSEGFAEPAMAMNRITTVAWVRYPDVIVFGSKPLTGEECNAIEENINKHVKSFGKKYRFIYKYHANEADMLYDLLYNHAKHAPLITGWNFWGYDWQYLMNRCKRLNMDISWLSPTNQWYEHKITDKNRTIMIMLPQHKLIVDYMEIYKKWDRTVEVKENYTLDFTAEAALGIKKVKYPGTLEDLYKKDFEQYVFYNAIDAVIVELLDEKLKTMGTFLGLGTITRVEAMNAFSPINMLEATLSRYAYPLGKVFPKTNERKERESYEGAFVFEPIPGLYPWLASLDFASLYPHLMIQYMISIENFIKKDKAHIPTEKQIKCVSGAIFDSSEKPLIPTILTDYYRQRKEAKDLSVKAEKEMSELKKIKTKRISEATTSLSSHS